MTPEERAGLIAAEYLGSGELCDGLRADVADAIRAAVAEERERCARVAENGSFLHDDSPEARFGREVAAAIRRGA